MVLGSLFWAEQEDDGVDGLLVDGGEVDAALRDADCRGHVRESRMLGVWDRDAAPDAGCPLALAVEDLLDEVGLGLWRHGTRRDEGGEKLLDHPGPIGRGQGRHDCPVGHDVPELQHVASPHPHRAIALSRPGPDPNP